MVFWYQFFKDKYWQSPSIRFLHLRQRLKNEPHAYILVIVAKALPENGHAADIFGCIRHADAETHLAFIGKGKDRGW